MPIRIVPHSYDLIAAAQDFNSRMHEAGVTFHVHESPHLMLPRTRPTKPYQEGFMAVEGDVIRGGYIIRRGPAVLRGSALTLGGYQVPVSEGTVNKRYGLVGVLMVKDAQQREPMLYMLGMGGIGEPIAVLIKKLGFHMEVVPGYYKVLRPVSFLRNIRQLRTSLLRRVAFDVAAFSGAAWAAAKVADTLALRPKRLEPTVSVSVVDRFSQEADELWQRWGDSYLLSAVRDSETLNAIYPPAQKGFVRIVVSEAGKCLGWAVVVDNSLSDHCRFGNMRLGAIADCFGAPVDTSKIMLAVTAHLRRRGVHLIVTNLCHAAWRQGMRDAGYFQGPSNFILGISQKLKQRLDENSWCLEDLHLTRGDSYGGAMDPDVWADWGAVWRSDDCLPAAEESPATFVAK